VIDGGDIAVADLGGERRHRVLVMSNARFHRLSERALVAPEEVAPPGDVIAPWTVEAGGATFAVDLVRSIPVERLLEVVGAASIAEGRRAQRALRAILS
jgi:hypothetical protein